jgi:hypothetical protein
MDLKLTDKAFGMKIWIWCILLAMWSAPVIIYLIIGEIAQAFRQSLWMLVGVLGGRAAYAISMKIKDWRAEKFINGYYTGRTEHVDGTVMFTRIPLVLPPRSFDFRMKAARNADEMAQLMVENLQEMYRLEPHLAVFLKSWVDDGFSYPPWATEKEIECIKEMRACEIIKRSKNEKINGSLENEESHV